MASVLAAGGVVAMGAGTASAGHEGTPPCLVVTKSTTLNADITDCEGHGILVARSGVVLDLNGHTVSGKRVVQEQAGVLLDGVRNVTVKNGTVTGFDAGVSIEGGGGNTITGINAVANVNDMIEDIDPRTILIDRSTGPTPEQAAAMMAVECFYGDGITTYDSDNNRIVGNTVTGNGPYSGISLVGDSDGNTVKGNNAAENDLRNAGVVDSEGNDIWIAGGFHVPAGTEGATRPNSMCGATEIGTPGMGRGREIQSIGIRVEGPGADGNSIEGNTVVKGGLAGISFHSYVLNPAASNVEQGESNTNNTVKGNDVSLTGVDTGAIDSFADGIASLTSGPAGLTTRPSDSNFIIGNTVSGSFRHGISLGRLTFDNLVSGNTVTTSGISAIWVAGPAAPTGNPNFDPRGAYDNRLVKNTGSGSAVVDGDDDNPDCGTNVWVSNTFGSVSQDCVGAGKPGNNNAAADASSAGMAHSSR
ncbi:MAG TPA: right-handed parallel beta-helix repeat-containing protein [Acidimicrobiales bacterium]|nr:right-handed parallel beta-helix repeat-containing protein [Acidimicrobiales bacterium]